MKAFKIVSKVMLILALVAFSASILVPGITAETNEMAFLVLVMANVGMVAAALVGAFLITSKGPIAKKVGHGLTISSFVSGLTYACAAIEDSIAAIIMIVAAALLALFYVSELVVFILGKGSPDEDGTGEEAKIARIREWKKIMDEGIISAEEFEEKRVSILGLKKNDKPPVQK